MEALEKNVTSSSDSLEKDKLIENLIKKVRSLKKKLYAKTLKDKRDKRSNPGLSRENINLESFKKRTQEIL